MYKKLYKKFGKATALIISLSLALLIAVGGSLAYLVTHTEAVINIFNPTRVTCEVVETFTPGATEKNNVTVKNTGTTSAYIRVAIVANWYDSTGNIVSPYRIVPDWEGFSGLPGSNWKYQRSTDSNSMYYFYYTKAVPAGQTISDYLFTSFDVSKVQKPENADHLEMVIISQAVQADGVTDDGTKAVIDAWGIDPSTLN